MKRTPLKEVGEFGLIDRLAKAWETGREREESLNEPPGPGCIRPPWAGMGKSCLRLGVGDDAAVIDVPAGKSLLTTTDMLVEGVHFLWSQSRARVLGRKALAANISDIAAMGGTPGWAFLSIGLPPRAAVEEAEELYAGMGEMAARFGVVLAGGDTVRSDKWVINITLLGISPGVPITRNGGRPGDLILVTGSVGDSAAGLYLLMNAGAGRDARLQEEYNYLLDRHLNPVPRVWEALSLARHGGVTAMIDVSDGVASEVHHICRNSACGAMLDLSCLPLSRQAKKLASVAGQKAVNWALYGGEDYELLFTAPPDTVPSIIKCIRESTGTEVTVIGRLTGAHEGIVAAGSDNPDKKPAPLQAKGYNHFT